MPLKTFHLLFIFLATMLCFYVSWWSLSLPGEKAPVIGVLSATCGLALSVYSVFVRKKLRNMDKEKP